MQNKGIVKFVAIVLILVCCFYLSFSFVTKHYESKAAAMGEEAGQEYLDSIMNEKVYCGVYSFKQCREMEIGLGLDLKGGMNVILEVSVPDVVDVLADHKTDATYKKAMELAKKEEETSQNDFISLFTPGVALLQGPDPRPVCVPRPVRGQRGGARGGGLALFRPPGG